MTTILLATIRRFSVWLFCLLLIVSSLIYAPNYAIAQTTVDSTELPTRILEIPSVNRQGNPTSVNALVPDWTQISFSGMPPISQSGSFSAQEYTQAVGYDLSRTWTAGQTPDRYIMLGDISEALQPELLSLGSIAQQTNYLNPNLPRNKLLLQINDDPTKSSGLPCLQVQQPSGDNIRQLVFCFNGREYQLAKSSLIEMRDN